MFELWKLDSRDFCDSFSAKVPAKAKLVIVDVAKSTFSCLVGESLKRAEEP